MQAGFVNGVGCARCHVEQSDPADIVLINQTGSQASWHPMTSVLQARLPCGTVTATTNYVPPSLHMLWSHYCTHCTAVSLYRALSLEVLVVVLLPQQHLRPQLCQLVLCLPQCLIP